MTDRPPLIAVTDAELEDLRAWLRATRWPVDGWEAAVIRNALVDLARTRVAAHPCDTTSSTSS
jgi:hypothetical protein